MSRLLWFVLFALPLTYSWWKKFNFATKFSVHQKIWMPLPQSEVRRRQQRTFSFVELSSWFIPLLPFKIRSRILDDELLVPTLSTIIFHAKCWILNHRWTNTIISLPIIPLSISFARNINEQTTQTQHTHKKPSFFIQHQLWTNGWIVTAANEWVRSAWMRAFTFTVWHSFVIHTATCAADTKYSCTHLNSCTHAIIICSNAAVLLA